MPMKIMPRVVDGSCVISRVLGVSRKREVKQECTCSRTAK